MEKPEFMKDNPVPTMQDKEDEYISFEQYSEQVDDELNSFYDGDESLEW